MSQFSFDARSIEPDTGRGDPIPASWQMLAVSASELKPTSSGDGQRIAMEFTVTEGVYKGRKVFHNFNVQNPSEKAEEIGQKQLSALCYAVNVLMFTSTEMLHNIPFKAKLKVTPADGQYEAKNEITAFKHASDPSAGAVGVVAGANLAAKPIAAAMPPAAAVPPAGAWQPPAGGQPWQQPASAQPAAVPPTFNPPPGHVPPAAQPAAAPVAPPAGPPPAWQPPVAAAPVIPPNVPPEQQAAYLAWLATQPTAASTPATPAATAPVQAPVTAAPAAAPAPVAEVTQAPAQLGTAGQVVPPWMAGGSAAPTPF